MWLVATILDSAVIEHNYQLEEILLLKTEFLSFFLNVYLDYFPFFGI